MTVAAVPTAAAMVAMGDDDDDDDGSGGSGSGSKCNSHVGIMNTINDGGVCVVGAHRMPACSSGPGKIPKRLRETFVRRQRPPPKEYPLYVSRVTPWTYCTSADGSTTVELPRGVDCAAKHNTRLGLQL